MTGKTGPWWQQTRVNRVANGFVAIVSGGNEENQPGKTLWDWLQLLMAPAVLALCGVWFTRIQHLRERKHEELQRAIAADTQREAALQRYLDTMSDLLLHEKLREAAAEDEVRKLARVRTLTVLSRLDSERKRSVLQFLSESGLIDKDKSIIDLSRAELSSTTLHKAKLEGAADLKDALDTIPEQREKVKSLQNAPIPDGSTHS